MENINKTPQSKGRVRFQDCDPFNHLNNGKYIDYMINAREDQVRDTYGFDIYDYGLKTGKSWVAVTNQIAYLNPAFMNEDLVYDSQIIAFTEKYLQVEIRMWNKYKTQVKAIIWSGIVHYDLATKKSTTHETFLMDLFKSAYYPVDQKVFEERIEYFRTIRP